MGDLFFLFFQIFNFMIVLYIFKVAYFANIMDIILMSW